RKATKARWHRAPASAVTRKRRPGSAPAQGISRPRTSALDRAIHSRAALLNLVAQASRLSRQARRLCYERKLKVDALHAIVFAVKHMNPAAAIHCQCPGRGETARLAAWSAPDAQT